MESFVYILEGKRIPTGRFGGAYKDMSAVDLGAELIEKLIEYVPIARSDIGGLYVGNVVATLLGQHPANQIKERVGVCHTTDASNFNKVCSSSLLAIEYGNLKIARRDLDVVIAGGVESMSNTPLSMKRPHGLYHPKKRSYALSQLKELQGKYPKSDFENPMLMDTLQSEGLCDAIHPDSPVMGEFAEIIIRDHEISRDQLDEYAVESYRRAGEARDNISDQFLYIKKSPRFDEGWRTPDIEQTRSRPPVFYENGRLTGANSSQLSDGAAALILVSEERLKRYEKFNKKPLARIVAFGYAGLQSREFLRAPTLAIQDVVKKAGLTIQDIDLFEINEAFPPAAIFAIKELHVPHEKVNPWGGAIANGHPLGASGAKILVNLCYVLKNTNGRYGIATTCNGGGEAMAVLVENMCT